MEYAVAGDPGLRVLSADLGLACCAVEFASAVSRGLLIPAAPDEPADLRVLVVSGTLTKRLEPDLLEIWQADTSRAVLAVGACASTGGPYWDSYSVTPGIGSVVPVAAHVSGCPPRPEALVEAIRSLKATS